MRFPSIRVVALLGGLAIAGCGASDIKHCNAAGNCAGGGTGGTGGGGSGGTGGSGGSGGTGGTGGGGGGGNNCGVQNFMLQKGGTPDLLIVQDRSGSMQMDATGGNSTPSKWTSVTQAIEQVVGMVNTVDWGLMFFGPDGVFGGCMISSMPQVPCGANTSSAITSAINATMPNGGTPTAEAINAAVQYFQGNNDGNSHFVMLATDGLPQCDTGDDSAAAITAVQNAVTAGIKVVVVGIGNDPMGDMTLTSMANAGGMPDTTGATPYYQVNTTNDLVTALGKIAGQIVSCSYPLTMVPPNPGYVEIDDNTGMPIPHDTTHMNGWDFGPGDMSIIFYGMACDNLQKGVTTSIQAVFGCPPVG